MKLNQKQIKDFKWVLSIFEGIDWVDPDSEFYDEPYIMIDGWMGGFLDYPRSELKDDLENAIENKEAQEVDGQLALDLVVEHCRALEKDGYF